MLSATALALFAPLAGAQEQPLPSVSDYRLPPPQPRATRAAGPVDPSNPVVPVRRGESTPAPAAPAPAAASPAPARSASPAPRPSASASRAVAAEPRRTEEARTRPDARASSEPRAVETARESGPESGPVAAEASPTASPQAPEPAAIASPGVQWNVHSAREAGGSPVWPWLAGIAVLLASNGYLLVLLSRRRKRQAEESRVADEAQLQMAPVSETTAEPQPLDLQVPAAPEPRAPAPQPAMTSAQPSEVPAARPSFELIVNPIDVTLAARQMSATLMNAVLHYELVVANMSDQIVGPIVIAGDMIGAHASLPTRSQLEISGSDIEPHHRHPSLRPGEWAKFTGEFRLPLSAITPIRSGRASLFVPLARFRVEVSRSGAPPIVVNRTFVIGESADNPEAALKPFRLDLGPRLYSHIGQREVAATG